MRDQPNKGEKKIAHEIYEQVYGEVIKNSLTNIEKFHIFNMVGMTLINTCFISIPDKLALEEYGEYAIENIKELVQKAEQLRKIKSRR